MTIIIMIDSFIMIFFVLRFIFIIKCAIDLFFLNIIIIIK